MGIVTTDNWSDLLFLTGMLYRAAGGVQPDLNAAKLRGSPTEASLCDHNCLDPETYCCPAAITLNKGVMPGSLVPIDLLSDGIMNTVAGIRLANRIFAEQHLQGYTQRFAVPSQVYKILYSHLINGAVEVNLFGGNPEMIKGLASLIDNLKQRGVIVNLTTTGRRFMRDQKFAESMIGSMPDLIALSVDDVPSLQVLEELCTLPMSALHARWKRIEWSKGQQQKPYEAIYTARWMAENGLSGQVLFNLVIHKQNMDFVLEMAEVLSTHLPQVIINPYPEQNAFMYESEPFDADYLARLEQLIERVITLHLELIKNPTTNFRLAPRLHYWLMLKAACIRWEEQPEKAQKALSGHGLWYCYKKLGAGRYVQFGKSGGDATKFMHPGGHLGCFWNSQTITNNQKQVWAQSPQSISQDILSMNQRSQQAQSPCWGCGFPRLTFDMISTETGMNPELVETYLALRKAHIGF